MIGGCLYSFICTDFPTDDLDGDLEPALEPSELEELDVETKETREPDETRESEQIIESVEAGDTVKIVAHNEVDVEGASRRMDS